MLMETKHLIYLGIFVGGTVGGLLGTWLDKGNGLGAWTIFLSTVGSAVGLWAGYKIGTS